MSFHATYSARNVVTNYSGLDISEGRPEDVFITIAENSDRASFRKGIDGHTSSALSSDNSYIVTLSYFPESATAKILTGIYSALKLAQTTDAATLGAVPLGIADPSGGTIFAASEAVMQSRGDTSLGEDTGTIDFVFYVESGAITALPEDLAKAVAEGLDGLGLSL